VSAAALQPTFPGLAAQRARRALGAPLAAARRLHAAMARRRARARSVAAFAALDARTLRDIGLRECEAESCRAELEGLAQRTRLRIPDPGRTDWIGVRNGRSRRGPASFGLVDRRRIELPTSALRTRRTSDQQRLRSPKTRRRADS
jgi:uncharacterized protein YjiS (DUF1127 family)